MVLSQVMGGVPMDATFKEYDKVEEKSTFGV